MLNFFLLGRHKQKIRLSFLTKRDKVERKERSYESDADSDIGDPLQKESVPAFVEHNGHKTWNIIHASWKRESCMTHVCMNHRPSKAGLQAWCGWHGDTTITGIHMSNSNFEARKDNTCTLSCKYEREGNQLSHIIWSTTDTAKAMPQTCHNFGNPHIDV